MSDNLKHLIIFQFQARLELFRKLIAGENHRLSESEFEEVAKLSDGYSGADIRSLCSEASLGPIRSINVHLIEKIQAKDVRPLVMEDFQKAFLRVKSSVSTKDLDQLVEWNNIFGSGLWVFIESICGFCMLSYDFHSLFKKVASFFVNLLMGYSVQQEWV